MAVFNGASSVDLHHNNLKKFETTSDGITVTGNVSATGFIGALTGNSDTTTALATARNIGGVSFDGTGDINLPGVNTVGNQNTSGNADTATNATTTLYITAAANNTANETVYLTFVDGATGTQQIETDTGLKYNPSTGVLTTTSVDGNITGNAATVTNGVYTNNNLSVFPALGTTSDQLRGIINNGTGTGSLVFATSPTLVTPALGTPASGNLSNCSSYPASSLSGTLSVAKGGTGAISLDNLITLGTHTTGNYVSTVANATDGGITVTGSGSESADVTVGMNINGLADSGMELITSGDCIAFSDESLINDPTKKTSIDNVATLFAGDGLASTNAVMALDLKTNGGAVIESNKLAIDLGATSITGTLSVAKGGTGASSLDNLITLGTHTTGNYVSTVANATDGGITVTGSGSESAAVTVGMNINGLATGNIASGDFIAFSDMDAAGNPTKKESIDDIATKFAGDGLTASSAVIALDLKTNGGAVIESNKLAIDLGASSITGTLANDKLPAVVSAVQDSVYIFTSSTYTDVTGLQLSITEAGTYRITAYFNFKYTSSTNRFKIRIIKNSTALLTLGSTYSSSRWGSSRGYNTYVPEVMIHVEDLVDGDTIKLQAGETSSGTLSITKSGIYAEKVA